MNIRCLPALAGSALILFACAPAPAAAPAQPAVIEAPEAGTPIAPAPATVIDVALASPEYSTLVAAIEAAGLTETLRGDGPFTVFAPTNAAFAALPAGTLDALLLPENKDDLVRVISYHVVPGSLDIADVPPEAEAGATASLNALDMIIRTTPAGVMVNDATVTTGNVIAANGVIHEVDKVLMPRMSE